MPLEGLNDYVDLNVIVNPWQALVVMVLIFAVMIWPGISASQTTRRIEHTLTTNNGGSTIKDAVDRIERVQAEHGKKLDDHVEWSAGYVKENEARLDGLACQTPGKRYSEDET